MPDRDCPICNQPEVTLHNFDPAERLDLDLDIQSAHHWNLWMYRYPDGSIGIDYHRDFVCIDRCRIDQVIKFLQEVKEKNESNI